MSFSSSGVLWLEPLTRIKRFTAWWDSSLVSAVDHYPRWSGEEKRKEVVIDVGSTQKMTRCCRDASENAKPNTYSQSGPSGKFRVVSCSHQAAFLQRQRVSHPSTSLLYESADSLYDDHWMIRPRAPSRLKVESNPLHGRSYSEFYLLAMRLLINLTDCTFNTLWNYPQLELWPASVMSLFYYLFMHYVRKVESWTALNASPVELPARLSTNTHP